MKQKRHAVPKFGLEMIGDIPWGTHLCQFSESKRDLVDILVPYFVEGLRGNELCIWITSAPREVDEALEALRKSVPDLDKYFKKGQIEIRPYTDWHLHGGKFDSSRVLQAWMEKEKAALKKGFEGLRLSENTFWVKRDLWKSFVDYEEDINSVIGKHRMIRVCTYCLTNCTGTNVLDVVRNHVGTIVKQGDKWYLMEDAARRKAAIKALKFSEQMYRLLFENMQDGFAYHRVVLDETGKPIDYVFLQINNAFERLTGLKRENIIGKRVTEALPGIKREPVDWIGVYGKVALTGKPARFENYSASIDKWFLVSAFSPEKGYFAVTFEDVTKRKEFEKKSQIQAALLERVVASLPTGVNLVRGDDLRYILVNPSYKAIAPGKEMLGKTIHEVWPEIMPKLEEIYREVLSTGQPHHSTDERFDIRRTPDGILETGYFSWSLYRVRLPGEDGWGVLNTVWETTERKKTEDAIRRLNERFEMAQHAAGAGVWEWNVKTGHIEWTAEMFRLFGLDPRKNEASFERWQSLLHPEDRENAAKKIDEALKTHSFLDNQYRVVRPDGQVVWINALGQGEYDDQKQPTRMSGICIDITDRKKSEQILLEQNLAISSAPDAIFSTDNSFIIKSWNKAAERIFGWEAEEVIGKLSQSILNPVYPTLNGSMRERAIEQLYKTGSWQGEITYHRKDGSPIPVSVSSSIAKDKNGRVVGLVAVVHDITLRKKREEALREAQHDLNRAQAVAKTGSWRLNTKENVLINSEENHRIFGIPEGASMTYETFLSKVHPDDRKYVDEKWKAGLRGEPYDIEHRIVVGGNVKWVREKAELEFDKDGTLLGGFGTTQDINDLVEMREKVEYYSRHLEELVEEKTKQLKDAERLAAIGQTAGMVGHDIRNPLQAIVGDIYLAKKSLDACPDCGEKENIRESLDAVQDQIEYINKIIIDLQDFARTLNPISEETDLKLLIADLLAQNDLPENIQAEVEIDDKAKMLMADSAYIRRILSNLISNAKQAMATKGGKLRLHIFRDVDATTITVEDTGEGIPEVAKSKIFQPLFTTKSRGQGFGLAVVKRLTEALNGTVEFESEEGKGTKFKLRFSQTSSTKTQA